MLLFVPNAPCGVESYNGGLYLFYLGKVPNAPCGVERDMG
jgi:hypothetical protein